VFVCYALLHWIPYQVHSWQQLLRYEGVASIVQLVGRWRLRGKPHPKVHPFCKKRFPGAPLSHQPVGDNKPITPATTTVSTAGDSAGAENQ